MKPLFISFCGNRKGDTAFGWAIANIAPPMKDGEAIQSLSTELERARGYDAGTLVIISFQRLDETS